MRLALPKLRYRVINTGVVVLTGAEDEAQRLLRQFDLTAKYGPCTNITRKQR